MEKKLTRAVLTGDIVNSTGLSSGDARELLQAMESAFDSNHFEFYRGDAFQVYIPGAENALEIALLCRCLALSIPGETAKGQSDVRIGIGLGAVEQPVEKLGTARGEAFLLSGRGFDGLADSQQRLIISAGEPWPALAFSILSNQVNGIFRSITPRQAGVLVELLKGNTQRDTAQRLGKSQSTVHQHLVAAGWSAIEDCLQRYRDGIALLNR